MPVELNVPVVEYVYESPNTKGPDTKQPKQTARTLTKRLSRSFIESPLHLSKGNTG